jgi:hypothetical protein
MNSRFTREWALRLGCHSRNLLFLAICVTIPEAAWSQQVTAAVTGKITDPSDAAIAGARVEAKDIARGTVWTAESNVEGLYSLPRVPVGRYEVRVEIAGFQTVVHPPFELVLNQTARPWIFGCN